MKLQIEIQLGDQVRDWADVCSVLKPCCAFPYEELKITENHEIFNCAGRVVGHWGIVA